MKKLITAVVTIILAFSAATLTAQQYSHPFSNNPGMIIEFSVGQGSDVYIEGYDGSEVIIRNDDYQSPPERAQGLQALYATGTDNTGTGVSVEEVNGTLKILPATRENGDFYLQVPNQVRLIVEELNWGGGDFEITNHRGEVEVLSKTGDVRMSNITGPVVISSTSGDVEVDFSQVSQVNPTSISLVSGFIDITLPAETRADFQLSSVSGEIYTDLEIMLVAAGNSNRGSGLDDPVPPVGPVPPAGSQSSDEQGVDLQNSLETLQGRLINLQNRFEFVREHRINGTLNGGGVSIDLKSVSGDIYLRGK